MENKLAFRLLIWHFVWANLILNTFFKSTLPFLEANLFQWRKKWLSAPLIIMFTFNSNFSALEVEKSWWSHSFSNIHSQPSALHFHWSASHFVYILVYLCRQCEIKQLSHSLFWYPWRWMEWWKYATRCMTERTNDRKHLVWLFKMSWNWDLMKVLELVPMIIITWKYCIFVRTWLFWKHIVFHDTGNHCYLKFDGWLIFMLILALQYFDANISRTLHTPQTPLKLRNHWRHCLIGCADGHFLLKIQSLIAY